MKAILPIRNYLGISQGMYGTTSHIGLKAIDFGWNSEIDCTKLYAPFDGKVVAKLGTTNTIAFQSNDKVEYADGTVDYMTVITCHDNNAPKVNTSFKQGEIYSKMGTAGGVPLHCHLEVQKGKYQKYTEVRKTSEDGVYSSYIFPNTIEPYKALFVADGTVLGKSSMYEWKFEENMERIEIKKEDGYEYKWSVDGNKFGEDYDITTQSGFADTELEKQGWERVLKVNGSLFFKGDDGYLALGLEKSRGVNNQPLEMSCVSNYNSCMAIAGVGDELWFARQSWIIANELESAYCAITGLGLIIGGKKCDDTYHKGFEAQWEQVSGRTIIGEDKEGNILSLSFYGETGKSGLTGYQAQTEALNNGFYNAIMLDGGGSVFREYKGKYDISTSRKVKNALILYRKEKAEEQPKNEPQINDELEIKYAELEAKLSDAQKQNEELTSRLLITEENYTKLLTKFEKIKELLNEEN